MALETGAKKEGSAKPGLKAAHNRSMLSSGAADTIAG
jgi:hypothetical protein